MPRNSHNLFSLSNLHPQHSGLKLYEIDAFISKTFKLLSDELGSERMNASDRTEQCGASKGVSGASKRVSERVNGPVLYV